MADLVALQNKEYDSQRNPYFDARLASLIEEVTDGSGDVDPEIKEVMGMHLEPFDSYIEILMAYRGRFHRQYITECLDSLLLKNKENGLLAQPRVKDGRRRFVMGSKLLEVLLQIAVLSFEDGQFLTRDIRVEDLLDFLRNRYGLYIDRLPTADQSDSIIDKRALRLNTESFKRRLREIGFYEDLSDAYITQKVSPRYVINRAGMDGGSRRSSS